MCIGALFTHFHLWQPSLEKQMRKCHAVVLRVVDVIVAGMCEKAELQCDENDFDDLNDKLVGESAMRAQSEKNRIDFYGNACGG
jgi:hypothetical protein